MLEKHQKIINRTEEKIRKKVAILRDKIKLHNKKLEDFQNNDCPHPNLTYTAKGSTGNWDRENTYWYEWCCDCCGKRWITNQDEEGKETRSRFPHATQKREI